MNYTDRALEVLKKNNFRITKPRLLVLDLLNKTTIPLSAYEIKDKLNAHSKDIDLVSIYRILDTLESNNLIHRILSSSKVMKCQLECEDHCTLVKEDYHCHHLLICERCGLVKEIHCSGIAQLIPNLQKKNKFKIKKHNLEFYGTCSNC